jgi:dTDP-4-amino-4,6-dideoxygalactose transaminase
MKKILFNNILPSKDYILNLEYLFSDYELFRKKHFSNLCLDELQQYFPESSLFLTHSATGALEMIATLIDVKQGDEIIMPSFTFVSTANAFVSKGAIPIFIDIDAETLNIDEKLVEQAITNKTKAIVAVHYAGHACNMKTLKEIADKHNLFLIEDAAMGFGNKYQDKYLGGLADFGVISFDITKHINAIQGGLLLIKNREYRDRANNIYHIGTNRSEFEKGETSYYEWTDYGSKYQMNELNAAVFFAQLKNAKHVFEHRMVLSKLYYQELIELQEKGKLKIMSENLVFSNIHEFYILLNTENERNDLSNFLKEKGVDALFHYIPLHNSPMGEKVGRFVGGNNTETISNTMLRLPLHTEINQEDVVYICEAVNKYFNQ